MRRLARYAVAVAVADGFYRYGGPRRYVRRAVGVEEHRR